MALNNITFVLGQGGLGRPLPGQDYISGLLFYTGALPSGFTANNRVKKFFAVSDAEAAGIKADYNDATAAAGVITYTVVGTDGNTTQIKVVEMNGVVRDLGTFVKTAAETTVTLLAAAVKKMINDGTINHGYTADNVAGVLTITAPKKFGIFLNAGAPLSVTNVAPLAGTVTTAFTGGVASKQAVWHYHISEFFRIQPKGILYVGMYAVPGAYTFAEVTSMQTFAIGTIRQIGVYVDGTAFSVGMLTALDIVCKANVTAHKELIALLGGDISAVTDLGTLGDLSALTANTASAIIAQDGAALGATLYQAYGKSITTLGATLGAVALAKVSESIAWVQKFNISDGTECDTIAFANGKLMSDPAITDNLLTQLQNYRYVFLRNFVGVAGSYFNENSAAIAVSSDYAYIADNRTIQKATRGVYTSLIPAMNSPLTLNRDGTLTDVTTAYLTGLAEVNLTQMVRDQELSAREVVIDPTQDVLTTGTLVITVNLVQIGTARNIIVNIGFQVSIN